MRRNQANCHQSAGGEFGRTVTAARLTTTRPLPPPQLSLPPPPFTPPPGENGAPCSRSVRKCVTVCVPAPMCLFAGLYLTLLWPHSQMVMMAQWPQCRTETLTCCECHGCGDCETGTDQHQSVCCHCRTLQGRAGSARPSQRQGVFYFERSIK